MSAPPPAYGQYPPQSAYPPPSYGGGSAPGAWPGASAPSGSAPPPAYGSVAGVRPGAGTAPGSAGRRASDYSAASAAGSSLDTSVEMRLHRSPAERQKYDDLADLYVKIKVTELVEAAFVRRSMTSEEYTKECQDLITGFKLTRDTLERAGHIQGVPQFMADYGLTGRVTRASTRLLVEGVPATVTHTTADGRSMQRHVRDVVQYFITASDSLRLNVVDVDEVTPLIKDVMTAMNRIVELPSDFAPKEKIMRWMETLNKMRASEQLNEDQTRQLLFDLDTSYADFNVWLDSMDAGK